MPQAIVCAKDFTLGLNLQLQQSYDGYIHVGDIVLTTKHYT